MPYCTPPRSRAHPDSRIVLGLITLCQADNPDSNGYCPTVGRHLPLGGIAMQSETPVRAHDHAVTSKLQWLALSLTPGVGPGRGRKLVEMYGGIDRLFTASLT